MGSDTHRLKENMEQTARANPCILSMCISYAKQQKIQKQDRIYELSADKYIDFFEKYDYDICKEKVPPVERLVL